MTDAQSGRFAHELGIFFQAIGALPLVAMLGVYSLLRLAFLLWNQPAFTAVDGSGIFAAFVHGLRFDLSTIVITNALGLLIGLGLWLAARQRAHEAWIRVLPFVLVVSNFPGVVFGLIDIGYYPFTGRRLTPSSFDIAQDVRAQLLQILGQYWFLVVTGVFLVAAVFLGARRLLRGNRGVTAAGLPARVAVSATFLAAFVLGARGGLQTKPLAPTHAFTSPATALGDLSLNSAFTFFRSPRVETMRRVATLPVSEVKRIVSADYEAPAPHPDGSPRPNFVVIIVESLATEYMGAANRDTPGYKGGYTPFLDELSSRGMLFRTSFANGRRSIESVTSIIAGIPSLMDTPWIVSPYKSQEMFALPRVLGEEAGYSSAFFHGGQNGTMFFDVFARICGFQHYIGLDEYPKDIRGRDFDGAWGIFDEPFLQFTADSIDQMKEPFFSTVFTLSSHNPYRIPDEHSGKFPAGTMKIHGSVGYADFALRKFFARAEKSSWYANTIFIITGDHTAAVDHDVYSSETGFFRVPLLIYSPRALGREWDPDRPVQHADVPATVFDLAGVAPKRAAMFGRSVFSTKSSGRVVNQTSNRWWIQSRDGFVSWAPNSGDEVTSGEETERLKEELRAFRQYYVNGLIDNGLWLETGALPLFPAP